MTNLELKELRDKTLNIFEVGSVDDLGESLLKACKDNDMQKLESFTELVGDLNTDWLQKIFQYYQADRKEKMQDYTPETLADFAGRLAGDSDEVIDMCAGSGALTIQKWRRNHELRFRLYEFDENVIPYLLFNMILRNIESTVCQMDVLQNEVYHEYRVKKGDKYGILEVIK